MTPMVVRLRLLARLATSTREANFANKTVTEDLDEFHGSLEFAHGNISCLSCHNSDDYDALKLADGSRVEFHGRYDALCTMSWATDERLRTWRSRRLQWILGFDSRDLERKNNCVDCHNPHSPKFPSMQPTFKPKDRFLEKDKTDGH